MAAGVQATAQMHATRFATPLATSRAALLSFSQIKQIQILLLERMLIGGECRRQ